MQVQIQITKLGTWYIRVATRVGKRLKTQDLRKLGNTRKVSKLHRMITSKQKFC